MEDRLTSLYSRIYRCEDCREIKDPEGVYYFVNGKGTPSSTEHLPATVPVANFGDVLKAKIWVVATNPNGTNRTDKLVGLPVSKFGVERRRHLRDRDIKEIHRLQCDYFRMPKESWHPYFLPLPNY